MKKSAQYRPQQSLLTAAVLFALAGPAVAQQATSTTGTTATTTPAGQDPTARELDTVVVKGIRGSLTSSMNLKRNAQGVVDGIVAEDIGKFPDTNLAESMQRISGVSIDRKDGEGSKVTVRGVGPDFNLVLLNGRQMPGSNLEDASAPDSRSFDFANIASEAVSAVEVFKTSRASTPVGGIGATINIKTARPFDNHGDTRASIGVKGVWDTSADNVPDSYDLNKVTPELAGIYSTTFADGRFGIGLSGSYQERDYGFSSVNVGNGWKTFHGDENNWGTIPQEGQPGSERIVNRPGPNDIYSVPQNLNFNVNGVHRERTNGQLVLQWAPTDDVTATLDYTYSQNKFERRRNEMSVWFNFGPSSSSWTDGPVAAPNIYSEIINPANSDYAMGGALNKTKSENKSLGLNVAWKATDRLNFALDWHNSTATTGSDSPWGSSGVLGTAGFFRGTTTADFSGEFPILNIQLPPGQATVDPAQMLVTGSSFRNSYQKAEVDQLQLSGDFSFENYSKLNFGVASTEVKNRSAFSNVQLDTWGGATSAADYPDEVWHLDHMGNYFDQFSGANNPNFTDAFFVWDFDTVRNLAEQAWVAAGHSAADYRASNDFTTDRRTTETSRSAYLEWSNTYDFSMPLNVAAGVRYESTRVESEARVPERTGISWGSANELTVLSGGSTFTSLIGKYNYVLPNLDLSLDVTPTMKLRGSYGRTLGRPLWSQIQGGQTLDNLVRVDGGTGTQGNPALKPLLSENFDLSFEWYYGPSSYMSVGYFRKNIDNYVGTTQIVDTPFDLHTPVGGAYWNAAIGAGGCPASDVVCIRNYIFDNFNGQPGVTRTGVSSATGERTGTIVGQPNDPIAQFRITVPSNQGSSAIDGWEFNIQHMFGESGFGLSANYTIVDSGLTYDNFVIGQQFALIGLSDTANVVGFYEKNAWSIRAAYNWRDQFLASVFDGNGPNPIYVEPYGQFDLNVTYMYNDNLSFSFEGINLTNETQRTHSRHENQIEALSQGGPRYMLGVRYKF
ncbi:TonB-dependent receptor [Lysobacter claricitrinus]|uniref:TonB-dependent receptor n=1 Tax=Lysobacter claricitrinus TaxID=3367728 RepID=UPI0037DAFDE7